MQTFIKPLEELAEYREIRELMKRHHGIIALSGCLEAQRAHMTYGLSFDVPCVVIITENELAARDFYDNIRFFEPGARLYPARDLLFYDADVKGNLLDRQRIEALETLTGGGHRVVVMPAAALMDKVTTRQVYLARRLTFGSGEEWDLSDVAEALAAMGYRREAAAEAPGQFSIRGDILDIWNITAEQPVRLEFFGDEIDTIRLIDTETQRSVRTLKETTILPANDPVPEETDTLLSWFDDSETVFFLVEPNRAMDAVKAAEEEFAVSIKNRIEQGSYEAADVPDVTGADSIAASLERRRVIALSALDLPGRYFHPAYTFGTTSQAVSAYNSSFDFLVKDLASYQKKGYRTILMTGSDTRARRLAEDLENLGVRAFYSDNDDRVLAKGEIMVRCGHISRGYEYPMIRLAVISETDIFGRRQKKRRKAGTAYRGERIAGFSELAVGDYVVHEDHGLGIYKGIEKVNVEGVMKDYIKIQYRDSNLYILATQLDLLQKYAGGDAKPPHLNKIGGTEWKKTRSRVKKAVSGIAKELVELYAARQQETGYCYPPDTPWQREFEELFPYEETDDQLAAIEDTKRDMESRKIMDRLICGDVGYGKTEVALRAAFKAVQENRQVVVLVPTTILAQQHFNTFTQRMKDFPVRIDLLCRFRTAAQQQKTIDDLKNGQTDIVIGTHRLLSKDIVYKNLGLLVIDEEQRFGVTHKERIKEMRKNVDVLTLTATPIPRTLHMSLIGIRDMSVLEEPPQDRVPIQTYVLEFNPELVREAVCRELNRHGQVYFVHNRVRDIADTARRIQLMVPEATVAFADGQMNDTELENIMVDFINGEIDVLVTTTIIETGLDIANVNTMIIQDADRMGLSQLYQLRGRIGRSNRIAYAYFMYRRDKVLKETAEKRLAAIREFTELGSGIKIAMRDLEIRGAGNLLGAEQSGHMASVGYDLYCKMLSEAVRRAKGEEEVPEFETVVDLSVNAFIPDSYIADSYQKIDIYKRIALIADAHDRDDMADELQDRFGKMPRSVSNLLSIAEIKAYAHRGSLTEIKETPAEIRLSILPEPTFNVGRLPELLAKWKGQFSFHRYSTGPCFVYQGSREEGKMLTNLRRFTAALAQLK